MNLESIRIVVETFYEYIMYLSETFSNFISTVMKPDYDDYMVRVWNKSEKIYTSHKIFNTKEFKQSIIRSIDMPQCSQHWNCSPLAALVGAYIRLLPFAPLARALLLLSCNFWFRSAISIRILPLPRFNFFSLLSVYQPLYYLLPPSHQTTYHLFFLYSLGLLSSPSFRCAATASSSSG